MSCTLVTVSTIGDVTKLKSLLNPVGEEDDGGTLIDQSFEWNWEEQGLQSSETEKNNTVTWLTDSIISLSPVEDFLVVAKKDIAIFLSRKWSSSVDLNAKGVYEIGYHGSLCSNEKESISSVLCVPLASQQRSSQGSPDWTCVVVGYTSGYIRIFTQSGVGILSQFLHDDAVIDLKIRTKLGMKRVGEPGEQVEELVIFYKKAIVVIDGFSLYQSLRACRNQIAKAQASGASDPIQPPPLAYRKWILQNQREATDVANCGMVTPCLFDRLQSASFLGGFNAVVKGSAPAFNHYVISGSDPFLAVYRAMEGVSPALLSDVAFQVASKLTSAVFSKLTVASLTVASGWLGIGRSHLQSDEKSNASKHVEKGTTLASRFGLQDRRRRVSNLLLSPTRHLCACTDDFGRILLIETFTGSVVRMWKGYRDAQCGWLLAEEEDDEEKKSGSNQQEQRRRALFLVIYGPRRGILEIWLTEQGVRVGAFNIGKDCRLICQGYTVLGRNIGLEDQFSYGDSHQCFLLKSNGEVKVINVPFHCALSISHSLQARDAHLMKRLTAILDKGFSSYDRERLQEISKSLISIVQEIQVPSSQMKATQLVVSNFNVSPDFLKIFLREVVAISSKTADNPADREDLEYEAGRHALVSFCHALIELTDIYVQLVELNKENSAICRPKVDLEDRLKDFAALFHLPVTEAKGYLTSIENYVEKCLHSRMPRRRSLAISELLSVSEFIACFEMPVQVERIAENPGSSKTRNWRFFKGNLSKEKTLLFGSFLYEDAIVGTTSVPELALVLDSLTVPARQQMDLLVKLTESDHGCCILEWPCIKNLHSLISSICSLEGGPGDENLQLDEDESWWDPVRDVLSSYGITGPALVTALVCRSVAMEAYLAAQKLKEADTDAELSKEGWEPISVDMEVWNLLVHRLDDLVALDCFLHTNHTFDESYTKAFASWLIADEEREALLLEGKKRRLHVSHSKSARAVALLSVQGLLENGHGAVACLVATCLAQQAVPGPCLGKLKKPAERSTKRDGGKQHRVLSDDVPDTAEDEEGDEISLLQEVKALRRRFPYSLQQDILWVHCCWECIMLWKEDVEEVPLLYSALLHLSCIHCTVLKQGLGQMMWKTVYKEIVMSFSSLMEKVGKAPKERLCRKTVGMSYAALEKFFATGQKLLEIMSEETNFENEYCPMFKEEASWQRKSKSHRSIEDQAVEEPSPDPLMLQHYWSLVVVLRLSLVVNIKGFRPLSLYDTKGKHLLTMALSSAFPTALVVADDIVELQLKFCSIVLTALVKRYQSSENDENARLFLQLTDVIWKLASYFSLEDDNLRSHYAVTLYSAGLDTLAYEASLLVHQKEAMARKLLKISGARLAHKILEEGDTESLTGAIAILPTHITSWLQTQDVGVLQKKQIPLSETLQLLVNIVPYFAADSKDRKFTQELIENVKFLNQ